MPAVLHVKPSASFAQSEPLTVNPSISLSFGPSVPLQSQKVWASPLPWSPHCPPPSHLHPQGTSHDDGGGSGLFSSGGPSVRFLVRYDGEVSEPLVGRLIAHISSFTDHLDP